MCNFNLSRGKLCMCMCVRTCRVHKCVIGVESVRVVLVGSAGHVQHHAPVRLRGRERDKVMSDKGSGLARCARRYANRKGGEWGERITHPLYSQYLHGVALRQVPVSYVHVATSRLDLQIEGKRDEDSVRGYWHTGQVIIGQGMMEQAIIDSRGNGEPRRREWKRTKKICLMVGSADCIQIINWGGRKTWQRIEGGRKEEGGWW